MTLPLRPYQTAAEERLLATYRFGKRAPIYMLPTGGGKTVLFADIARRAAARGNRVLILVHRDTLMDQASDKLNDLGLMHAICAPGYHASARDNVMVGSVQTVVRRLSELGEFQLIIIDECHHSRARSWATILAAQPRARLLGVTATPARLDGQGLGVHCGGFFDALIEGPSMAKLIAQGYLAPLKVFAPRLPTDADNARLHKRAGEITAESSAAIMDRPVIHGDVISHYRKYADGERGIAFCSTVEHATHAAEAFCAAGIPAEHIDGTMKRDERRAVLARFAGGETIVLTSCELISEGFDCPEAVVAIKLRHTASLVVDRQQSGRVCRWAPNKTAIILDHVGNYLRHGRPDEPVEWSLDGEVKRPRENEAGGGSWRCPECLRVCSVRELKCPECGCERPHEKRKPPRQVAGELVQVAAPWEKIGISYEQYAATVIERERKLQAADRKYFSRIARDRGYKDGWIFYRVKARHEARLAAAMTGQSQIIDYGSRRSA